MFNVQDNIFYSVGAVLNVWAFFQFHYWNSYSPNMLEIKWLYKHFLISGFIFCITAKEVCPSLLFYSLQDDSLGTCLVLAGHFGNTLFFCKKINTDVTILEQAIDKVSLA